MLKISSTALGLVLLAASAWFFWFAGGFGYRHAYVPAAFGVALLALAFYGSHNRTHPRIPLLASAVLATAGIAWGLDGAIETRWLLYGPANMLVNAVVETVTVILLSTHLLLNVLASVRPSRRVVAASN
jgi:hypothetical protein